MVQLTLGEVAEYINGRAFKPTEWEETGKPIIRIQNLTNSSEVCNRTTAKYEDKYLVHAGDLLFAWSASLGAYIWNDEDGWLNQHIFKIVPNSNVDKMFLYYYLLHIVDQLYAKTHGSGMVHITLKPFKSTPILVPDMETQLRIVDRIESLFAKLDDAKEKAQAALDSFETRKAAILHKAFSGELTAGWRKEHGIGMESWNNIQWGSFISSIDAGKNWSAVGRPPKNNEFGVVKVSAVTWGEFNESESKTCTSADQWNIKKQIHVGDFLFSRANTLQLVGNCVIVKRISRRLMLSDKILRFSFSKAVIPEYILYYTRSNLYRKQIERLASGNQDGMRNVSQKNMKLVKFPIPIIAEQTEIVRILDSLLAKEQQAKEAAEAVLEQIDLIKKSILARAFRGELGANDPGEESAVELVKSLLLSQ